MANTENKQANGYGPSEAKLASDASKALVAESENNLTSLNAGLAAQFQTQQQIAQIKTDALNGIEVAALQKLAAEGLAAVAAVTPAVEPAKVETNATEPQTPAGGANPDAPKLTAKTARGEEKELEAMTRAELEEVATAEKVDVAFAKNKAEVLEAVKAALTAKAAAAPAA